MEGSGQQFLCGKKVSNCINSAPETLTHHFIKLIYCTWKAFEQAVFQHLHKAGARSCLLSPQSSNNETSSYKEWPLSWCVQDITE